MSQLKWIVTIIFSTFCFAALAQKSPIMNENKSVVIKYDFSLDKCLKESTADLHPITKWTLYLEGDVNLELLGEKDKIVIPGITKTDITFAHEEFSTLSFLKTPLGKWYTLELSIEQIHKIREQFEKLDQLAIKKTSFDISSLTLKSFDNKESLIVNKYELEHYKIFVMLKKYPIPREITPRDNEYFQLVMRIDRKDIGVSKA